MRGQLAPLTLMFAVMATMWLSMSNHAWAENDSVKKTLDAIDQQMCQERKNIKRIECLKKAFDTISSHLEADSFSKCIPLHGQAPRAQRKPFKKAMKQWFPSSRTLDFIRPDLTWSEPEKPLGVSGMESCFTKTIEARAKSILDLPPPTTCRPTKQKTALSQRISTIGGASPRLLSVLASSTGRSDDIIYPYQWKGEAKSSPF